MRAPQQDLLCPLEAPAIEPLKTVTVQYGQETANGVQLELASRVLASEVPISLVYNGIAHAVMMASPLDIEDFALGFSLSEGILDDAADCYGIEVRTLSHQAIGLPEGIDAIEAQLDISSRSFMRLKDRRRSISGRTGCGVCGVESFAGLDLDARPVSARDWIERIDLGTVNRAIDALASHQALNAQAGAIHAAAWATLDGRITDALEDVGRHNALDKLIGRLARQQRLDEPGFVVLSSRGSHELVRKCARMDIAGLATISAPTAMGVRMAELTGIRFWGMCRPPKATLYHAGAGA